MSTICVHGLGYIGLPTAAMFANYGHEVRGYDTNDEVREILENGEVHIDEPGLRAFVTQALEAGDLDIRDEVEAAKYHVICVPTPFDHETKEADLSYVRAAGKSIAKEVRVGDTVILESTVPPATTVEELQPVLEQSGLEAGKDFALVHCPETVLPGNIITELTQNDRIVGGVNGVSTEAAVRLYDSFIEGKIRTTDNATTAEFVKLIQNTFRDTNIALANEIAKLAHDYDIDSREAIQMANRHPRVKLHQPGPGVGGHCLPIDPWFLGHGSDELDLIAKARDVNDRMVDYVIRVLRDQIGSLAGKKIAILGVAYKGNVSDVRESPGLKIARSLQGILEPANPASTDGGIKESPEIALTDPNVTDQTLSLQSLSEAVTEADAAIIATDHDEYRELNPEEIEIAMGTPTVIDTKGLLNQETWERAGLTVIRI